MNQTGDALPLEIDVHAVQAMLVAGDDFLLLDCREKDEHELVRIGGSTLLPMSEIQARAAELESHRQRRIVVHCHHGGRSLRVTQWLRGQGYAGVQNMTGGIDQWAVEVDPALPRY
jgi:rhodanese-related sulfurtransferase